jgi:hypothetical protein
MGAVLRGSEADWAASRVNGFEFIEDILNLGTTTITEVFAVRKDPGLKSLV